MRIEQLLPLRVALWGFGREGRASLAALRTRAPGKALTLFCNAEEAQAARALADPALTIVTQAVDAALLGAFDLVIKSPGISPYREPAASAIAVGVRMISGSAIWFAEHPEAATICVTGTKGKSTVSALIAHLLRGLNVRTALAGNIGLPLLELLDPTPPPDCWVIELSSFQTRDFAASPGVAVLTNLIEEHLDWHGSVERYLDDKLRILGADPATRIVANAADPLLAARLAADPRAVGHAFNHPDGWHLAEGFLCLGPRRVLTQSDLPLPGRHNAENACAALAAVAAAGFDALAAARHLLGFQPLPHRLQTLGERDGITFVDDSIATTPQAAVAALRHFAGQRLAILIGGHERGLDWRALAEQVRAQPPHAIVCTGATGERVFALLAETLGPSRIAHPTGPANPLQQTGTTQLLAAADFDQAFALARSSLSPGGVLLLSPGAPSFGQFRDYIERGQHFAKLAGFEPANSSIRGLGIA
ncbi:MAG: UDP-N-acetylmuramoyl-L-alanine--D-glutamate ligase [Lysobacterales bacterium]